jgi:hypothetical protein
MRIYPKMLAPFVLFAALSAAQERFATEDDMAKLQADLTNLEADLASVETLPEDLVQRVDTVREEAVYLKVKMRKHQEAGGESTGVARNEVRDLRLDVADLRNDVAPYMSRPASAHDVTIEAGREIAVRLEDSLSSRTAHPGDAFTATAVQPVVDGNIVAIEAGSLFSGRVELVDQASGRTDRKAKLVLAVNELERHGVTHSITATVVRASERLETGIGSEAKKIGIGAGLGTVLGAVLGGKKGAAIGAVVGGGGSILATEGNEVELPRGTILYLRLDRDLTMPLEQH